MTMLAVEAGEDLGKNQAKKAVTKRVSEGPKPSATSQNRVRRTSAPKTNYSKTIQSTVPKSRGRSSTNVQVGRSSYYKGSGGKTSLSLKPPGILTGGNAKVSSLMIEWIIGVVIIAWAVLSGKGKKGTSTAHDFFWRFFAWSFVFFVLALVMRGRNTGKIAVMFGAILDLALVLLNVADIASFATMFSNPGKAGVAPASSGTPSSGGNNPDQPQSSSNPGGIPNPFTDPLGFLKQEVTNPPSFLKFFDPFHFGF